MPRPSVYCTASRSLEGNEVVGCVLTPFDIHAANLRVPFTLVEEGYIGRKCCFCSDHCNL